MKEIILHKSKEECSGCSACYNICPQKAIKMEPDSLGFLYPKIDESKCIGCRLCENVCSFNKNYLNQDISVEAYAVRHKDLNEVLTSRSGAAFIALANYVLDRSGVVYGAGFSDDFNVKHFRITDKKQLNKLKGSKYVQSELCDSFKHVKHDLEKGLLVMFTGTPCQIAGLNSFIGNSVLKKRLYLVDIVCHGVPSPSIWRDYLEFIKVKHKKNIIKADFRDKSVIGWKAHKESFIFEDNSKIYSSIFTKLFYEHIMLRESCYVCYFSNLKRVGDITLADFWGWEKIDKSLNKDDQGLSLVLCNTLKGKSLFNKITSDINFKRVDINDCIQPNLKYPSKRNSLRSAFEYDYEKLGFNYIKEKYVKLKYKDIVRDFFRKYEWYNLIVKVLRR